MKKSNKFKFPVKLITVILIIFLALFFIMGYIWRIIRTSDYFRVADIIAHAPSTIDLSYLKGRNIFSINLKKESANALQYNPDFKKVRLARVLPNRIFVDVVKRSPIAWVKSYKYFLVDESDVLFSPQAGIQDTDLPVITGLESKISRAGAGSKCNIRELVSALDLIRGFTENKRLRDYKIKRVEVGSSSGVTVFISLPLSQQYLEVRFGQVNLRDKIVFLADLAADANRNLSDITYVDLRFKEPVIRPKDVKQISK